MRKNDEDTCYRGGNLPTDAEMCSDPRARFGQERDLVPASRYVEGMHDNNADSIEAEW